MDVFKRKFTENLSFLKQNITGVEEIVDILIEKQVINFNDRPKFLSEHTSQKDKIHHVLHEVITKKKYEEFFYTLGKTGNTHVLGKLSLTDDGKYIYTYILI